MPSTRTTRAALAAFVAGAVFAMAAPACGSASDDDRQRALAAAASSGTGFQDVDAGNAFCGNEIHEPLNRPPLLYFVADTSGSMAEPVPGGTKYVVLREAVVDVARSLGALIRVGAAVFPSNDQCGPGKETLAPRLGDAAGETATTQALEKALLRAPNGGTPTASTLALVRSLLPPPTAGDGPVAIVLVTDGAPNCGDDTSCDAADCQINIENQCASSETCCTGDEAILCLDRADTLTAIASFGEIGAKVYVVGLALDPAYDKLMSQMALAGGGARDQEPYYYRADDSAALVARLREIASALVTCTYVMDAPPDDAGLVNVYFDQTAVPFDPYDGWQWRDERTIEIVGEACGRLKNGAARKVNIVTGCPTLTPT